MHQSRLPEHSGKTGTQAAAVSKDHRPDIVPDFQGLCSQIAVHPLKNPHSGRRNPRRILEDDAAGYGYHHKAAIGLNPAFDLHLHPLPPISACRRLTGQAQAVCGNPDPAASFDLRYFQFEHGNAAGSQPAVPQDSCAGGSSSRRQCRLGVKSKIPRRFLRPAWSADAPQHQCRQEQAGQRRMRPPAVPR
jgi:hypothetical protein